MIEGNLIVRDARFCIIASRFNATIVDRLVEGACETLRQHGVDESQIEIVRVPGAFELPLAAQRIARQHRFDAIVALGVVIRGATPHFDFVAGECARGLGRVSLENELPVGFGVLTCDTIEQAWERSGTKAGNKGVEATRSAIEMVSLLPQLQA